MNLDKAQIKEEMTRVLDRVVPGSVLQFDDHAAQYTWDGNVLTPSGETITSQLHDLVHVCLASKRRRLLPECGLGPDPYRCGSGARLCVKSITAQHEEDRTCMVHVALAAMWLNLDAALEVIKELDVEELPKHAVRRCYRYRPDAFGPWDWIGLEMAYRQVRDKYLELVD